jgi:hypothetical protein
MSADSSTPEKPGPIVSRRPWSRPFGSIANVVGGRRAAAGAAGASSPFWSSGRRTFAGWGGPCRTPKPFRVGVAIPPSMSHGRLVPCDGDWSRCGHPNLRRTRWNGSKSRSRLGQNHPVIESRSRFRQQARQVPCLRIYTESMGLKSQGRRRDSSRSLHTAHPPRKLFNRCATKIRRFWRKVL